jgi:hypothetical protein
MMFCRICKKPVLKKRIDARYCSTTCKSEALSLRRRQDSLARLQQEEHILHVWAPQILKLEREIWQHAPKEAGGYRVGFWLSEPFAMYHWLPFLTGEAKRRRMLSGRYSYHDYFQLYPFEPPTVPAPGRYRVQYVAAHFPHTELITKEELHLEIPFSVHVPNLVVNPRSLRV